MQLGPPALVTTDTHEPSRSTGGTEPDAPKAGMLRSVGDELAAAR
jgi:hypothetical protein